MAFHEVAEERLAGAVGVDVGRVDEAFQGQGIGRELVRRTREAAGLATMLILLAAPKAQTYYPHIGMTKHESCWIIPRQ